MLPAVRNCITISTPCGAVRNLRSTLVPPNRGMPPIRNHKRFQTAFAAKLLPVYSKAETGCLNLPLCRFFKRHYAATIRVCRDKA